MKKFIATNCEFTLHEDHWNEGEGKLFASWDEDIGEADTICGLLNKIQYLDNSYMTSSYRIQDMFAHDPCCSGELNRFDADLTVDIEYNSHYDGGFRIITPSEEKWKLFQTGKVKLYSLHIVVHVKKIEDLDIDDVCNEGWQK